jgi:hypothetical protein
MKMLVSLVCILLTLSVFTGCASTQYVRNPADYNGDGFISDAEWQQYERRQGVRAAQLREEQAERARQSHTQQQLMNLNQMIQQYENTYGQ